MVWIPPSCISDLSAAADKLKRERPQEFGALGVSAQAFGLFIFSYSCGSLIGPIVAGVIKSNMDWSAATLTLALVCVMACVPIVSFA